MTDITLNMPSGEIAVIAHSLRRDAHRMRQGGDFEQAAEMYDRAGNLFDRVKIGPNDVMAARMRHKAMQCRTAQAARNLRIMENG